MNMGNIGNGNKNIRENRENKIGRQNKEYKGANKKKSDMQK